MTQLPNIRCGTIICAQVVHPSGRGRDIERYYLVISATEENIPTESIWCLGISKQCPDPAPPHAILLPYCADPKSRAMSGLRQRSAAFVDWYIEIKPAEIVDRRVGYVSAELFEIIMDAFEAYRKK